MRVRVWTSNDFTGENPVGSALVVVAYPEGGALAAAKEVCEERGLTFDGTLEPLPLDFCGGRMLCDGEY